MTNNDVLRRIRYIFDLSDSKMIAIFKLADDDVSREASRLASSATPSAS